MSNLGSYTQWTLFTKIRRALVAGFVKTASVQASSRGECRRQQADLFLTILDAADIKGEFARLVEAEDGYVGMLEFKALGA